MPVKDPIICVLVLYGLVVLVLYGLVVLGYFIYSIYVLEFNDKEDKNGK